MYIWKTKTSKTLFTKDLNVVILHKLCPCSVLPMCRHSVYSCNIDSFTWDNVQPSCCWRLLLSNQTFIGLQSHWGFFSLWLDLNKTNEKGDTNYPCKHVTVTFATMVCTPGFIWSTRPPGGTHLSYQIPHKSLSEHLEDGHHSLLMCQIWKSSPILKIEICNRTRSLLIDTRGSMFLFNLYSHMRSVFYFINGEWVH